VYGVSSEREVKRRAFVQQEPHTMVLLLFRHPQWVCRVRDFRDGLEVFPRVCKLHSIVEIIEGQALPVGGKSAQAIRTKVKTVVLILLDREHLLRLGAFSTIDVEEGKINTFQGDGSICERISKLEARSHIRTRLDLNPAEAVLVATIAFHPALCGTVVCQIVDKQIESPTVEHTDVAISDRLLLISVWALVTEVVEVWRDRLPRFQVDVFNCPVILIA